MANPAWLGLSYARLTEETTYGTYTVANHSTSKEIFVRLHQSNPFTMRGKPDFYKIRGADGLNRTVQAGSGFTGYVGSLTTLLQPTQCGLILGWAAALTSNDLKSFTVDWSDSVRAGQSYLGCKIARARIQHTSRQQYAVLTLDLVAQTQAASNANFVAPAATDFPALTPYTHQQSVGGLTVGSVRTKYKSLDLSISNKLIAPRDELGTISCLFFGGRDISTVIEMGYYSSADRVALETLPPAAQAVSVVYTAPGPHTLTIDLKGTSFIEDVDDDSPLDDAGYQKLTLTTMFDRTFAGDCAITAT